MPSPCAPDLARAQRGRSRPIRRVRSASATRSTTTTSRVEPAPAVRATASPATETGRCSPARFRDHQSRLPAARGHDRGAADRPQQLDGDGQQGDHGGQPELLGGRPAAGHQVRLRHLQQRQRRAVRRQRGLSGQRRQPRHLRRPALHRRDQRRRTVHRAHRSVRAAAAARARASRRSRTAASTTRPAHGQRLASASTRRRSGDNEGECPEGPPTGICSLSSGHQQRSCTTANDCCDDAPALRHSIR